MSFVPEQEPDRIPGAKLARIGVVSTAIAIASVIVAVAIVRAQTKHIELYADTPAPEPRGTVERGLVSVTARGWDEKRAQRAELERFGRDGGVAHVPIDRAMDLWLQRNAEAR
ncbi:MAG TPA: hypothetical protein VIF62_21180 [Labilithrix sp.]